MQKFHPTNAMNGLFLMQPFKAVPNAKGVSSGGMGLSFIKKLGISNASKPRELPTTTNI